MSENKKDDQSKKGLSKPATTAADKSNQQASASAAATKPAADKVNPAADQQSAKDQADKPTVDPAVAKKAAPEKASTYQANMLPPAPKTSPWAGVLAGVSLLGVLGLAGGGFWFWQQHTLAQQEISTQKTQLSQLKQALEGYNSQFATLQQGIQQGAQHDRRQGDQLQALQAQTTKLIEQITRDEEPQPRDWLMAEAEYLMRLANQRLQLEGDVKGALALLLSADARLQEADEAGLVPVRGVLKDDILTLKSITPVDLSEIILRLMAATKKVDALPFPSSPELAESPKDLAQLVDNGNVLMQQMWEELKQLVVVRQRGEAVVPLLPPQETEYLRHNLKLQLEQAQMAAMRAEETIYQQKLAQAGEWMNTYFAKQSQEVQALGAELTSLGGLKVTVARPDITGSLAALKKYLRQRYDTPVPAIKAGGDQA